jgi:hypothetical protein
MKDNHFEDVESMLVAVIAPLLFSDTSPNSETHFAISLLTTNALQRLE